MAPQNEVSIEKAVKSTEVQTFVYSIAPQSELKGLPGTVYGFIPFSKHMPLSSLNPLFYFFIFLFFVGLNFMISSVFLKSTVK